MTELLQLVADLCGAGAIIVPFLFVIHSRRFARGGGPARVGHFTTISYYVEQAYAAPAKGSAIPTYYLMRQNSAWSSILLIYMALFAIFIIRYADPASGGIEALFEIVLGLLAIARGRGVRDELAHPLLRHPGRGLRALPGAEGRLDLA